MGKLAPNRPPGPDLLGIAGLSQLFTLVLGILAVSTEFRHGTITPSLLVVPDRTRLVLAKLAAPCSPVCDWRPRATGCARRSCR